MMPPLMTGDPDTDRLAMENFRVQQAEFQQRMNMDFFNDQVPTDSTQDEVQANETLAELDRLNELNRERNSTLEAYDPSTKDFNVDPLATPYGGIPDLVKDSGMFTDLIGRTDSFKNPMSLMGYGETPMVVNDEAINRVGDGIAPPLMAQDVPLVAGTADESTGLQREAFDKYLSEQVALGGDPNQPRSDDNPGGYAGMQRAYYQPQYQDVISELAQPQNQLSVTPTSTPPPFGSTTGSSLTDASSNDIQRMLNRGTVASNDVSDVQSMVDSPQPITPPTPATAPAVEANPIIDVLGTGNVLDPGTSGLAPAASSYDFGVQDTFNPDMMSEYQNTMPQLPSFGQEMQPQAALPQGGLGSLSQPIAPLQQFNVSGSFNAPPIKSPYV